MYRNRFALKKLKPNKVLGFFLLCSFLIFLIFSIFAKFSFAKTYTGTYLCSKNECTLTSMLLVQEIENLNSKQNIYIGEEQVELKIKTFKNVQYYDAIPVQEVVFIVPKFETRSCTMNHPPSIIPASRSCLRENTLRFFSSSRK